MKMKLIHYPIWFALGFIAFMSGALMKCYPEYIKDMYIVDKLLSKSLAELNNTDYRKLDL